MTGYVLRRLGWGVFVLLAVAVLTFFLTYVLPSNPARTIAGINASAEDVARIRHALGLDRPLLEQMAAYFGRLANGDLGHSYHQNAEVLPLLLSRFSATLQLALAGLVVELAIGLPLGIAAATHRGKWLDRLSTTSTVVLVSAPSFWVGYLLLEVVFQLNQAHIPTLPVGGGYQPFDLRFLFLPALTLGFGGAAYYSRLTRAAMIEELGKDYVRTARSKGLRESKVLRRHVLRNALGPVITQVGLDLGFFLGGVVVVEQVFSWPGIGRLAVDSILNNDVPLIMGTVLFGTVSIVLANLAVDIVSATIDPRVRIVGRSG